MKSGSVKLQDARLVVIGAGIIGMTIALELKQRFPSSKIVILEKEADIARHGSGRNSGVLHAGFYYTADSLKARLTVEGNRLMQAYCKQNNLKLNKCGKVVVATRPEQIEQIYELEKRGKINGVNVRVISEAELQQIDENVKTCKVALLSPDTAVIDPKEVCRAIATELAAQNVHVEYNCQVTDYHNGNLITNQGRKPFDYVVNAAGLYADRIAHLFDCGREYIMLPFKGLYLKSKETDIVKKHVYGVPDLNQPFLGVHFTKTVSNETKIGPTAIPAFWRENYRGLSNFSFKEFCQNVFYQLQMFFLNRFNFRLLAKREMKKFFKGNLLKEAGAMVKWVGSDYSFTRAGIRAQLYNKETKQLESDFVIKHQQTSTHILNAVSPAFTCAFSFAQLAVDEIEGNYC